MQKFNFTKMSPREIELANNALGKRRYGHENRIVSGSYEQLPDGGKRYNICLGDTVTYNRPLPMLKRIGERVKLALEAKEVYYMGTKLA